MGGYWEKGGGYKAREGKRAAGSALAETREGALGKIGVGMSKPQ